MILVTKEFARGLPILAHDHQAYHDLKLIPVNTT